MRLRTVFWDSSSEDNDAAMRELLAGRGQKALAAIHAASSAGQNAMALAVNMAQESNLAANLANQAQAYLERYVYGRPMSALPANVAPEPPALVSPPKEISMRGFSLAAAVIAGTLVPVSCAPTAPVISRHGSCVKDASRRRTSRLVRVRDDQTASDDVATQFL